MSASETVACLSAITTLPKDRYLTVLFELSKTVPNELLAAIREAN